MKKIAVLSIILLLLYPASNIISNISEEKKIDSIAAKELEKISNEAAPAPTLPGTEMTNAKTGTSSIMPESAEPVLETNARELLLTNTNINGLTLISNTNQLMTTTNTVVVSNFDPNMRYFEYIELYPVKGLNVPKNLTRVIFAGYSESAFMKKIQKSFFFYTPKGVNQLYGYKEGAYIIKRIKKKNIFIIYQPDVKFRLLLQYDRNKRLRKKVSYYGKAVIDRVDYKYKNGKRYYAYSRLYGHYYYTKPDSTKEKLIRLVRKYLPNHVD